MKPSNEPSLKDVISLLHRDFSAGRVAAKSLNEEEYRHFQHYLSSLILHSEAAQYRGKVVEMSIYLEAVMAKVLSCYFGAKDKLGVLNSIVFDRMDLQMKINKFKTILKILHSDVWKREMRLIKEIDKHIAFRNNLAHSILNSTREYDNEFRKKIDDFIKGESNEKKIDQVEFGYFDNHKFVYTAITRENVEQYHQSMIQVIKDIERIAKEIIPDYE